MKYHKQTKLHNPPHKTGNCFATCVACLLDLEIEDVPNVELYMNSHIFDWAGLMHEFLNRHGYTWERIVSGTPNIPYLVKGDSYRGVTHFCIYQDGKLLHDPHPDNTGLKTEEHIEVILKNS